MMPCNFSSNVLGAGINRTGPATLLAVWLVFAANLAPATETLPSIGGKQVVRVQLSSALSPETLKDLWDVDEETFWQTPYGANHGYPHEVRIFP